jgi:hypothetical protein
VALFPVRVEVPPEPDPAPEYRQILDFDVSPASYEPLLLTLGGLALVIVLLIGSNVAVFLLMRRRGTLPARQKPA